MHGLLPDHEITRLGARLIEPFDPARVQPASYDLTLYDEILVPTVALMPPLGLRGLDLRYDRPCEAMNVVALGEGYELLPGACLLASTSEVIRCPDDIAARVEGKSSLGRLFLAVHVTAGWIDPGWNGRITLEVVNHGPWKINLWPGMGIAQVNFTRLMNPCVTPYGAMRLGSHYQGQSGPAAAFGRRNDDKSRIP